MVTTREAPELGALTYVGLRRCIGVVAAALPFLLLVGKPVRDAFAPDRGGLPGVPGSMSAYYHTSMRNVFVGALCVISVFLFCYRYSRDDRVWSLTASAAALGVAMLPTLRSGTEPSTQERVVQVLHLASAAVLFGVLAHFCLSIFRRTGAGAPTPEKLRRNAVYLWCGRVIVAAGLLAVANGVWEALPGDYPLNDLNALFWLEAVMVEAFAVSWIVKGEWVLADKAPR